MNVKYTTVYVKYAAVSTPQKLSNRIQLQHIKLIVLHFYTTIKKLDSGTWRTHASTKVFMMCF